MRLMCIYLISLLLFSCSKWEDTSRDADPFETKFHNFHIEYSKNYLNESEYWSVKYKTLLDSFSSSDIFENIKPKDEAYIGYINYINRLTKIDSMFMNGFKIKLIDIYVNHNGKDTTISLSDYVVLPPFDEMVPEDITIFEQLTIDKVLTFEPTITYLDEVHHYGNFYDYLDVHRNNFTINNKDTLFINFVPGISKKYFKVMSLLPTKSKYYTNLIFENIILDGNYLIITLNPINFIKYVSEPPLTGKQVKEIIENGEEGVDWEIYLLEYNNISYTTYKIKENLYVPTIGNTYRYIGSTNMNGVISELVRVEPVLIFEILNN